MGVNWGGMGGGGAVPRSAEAKTSFWAPLAPKSVVLHRTPSVCVRGGGGVLKGMGASGPRHKPHRPTHPPSGRITAMPRAVLNGKKKSVPEPVFPKKPAGTPCAQPWLVAVGGWRLAVGSWRLAVGRRWQLVAVGGWRLAAVGGWRSLAVGSWQLAVGGGWWRLAAVGGPLGRSLRAVLSQQKKIWSLKDRPGHAPLLCHSGPSSPTSGRCARSPFWGVTAVPFVCVRRGRATGERGGRGP